MALSESAKLSIAFKKLIGREHRYSSNQWYNECPDRTLVFHKDVIMVNSIPSSPPAATSSAIKVYTDAGDGNITMCADNTIPGNRGWRANDAGALRNFIHPKFGSGYVVRVYEDDGGGSLGDEVPSSDTVEWTFDYENGYLSLENSPTSWTLPLHIEAYKYTGSFLDSYMELTALSTDPATPPANTVRLYALDSAGTTKLLYIDSAGTKTQIGAGGGAGNVVYIEEGATAVTDNAASGMYISFDSSDFNVVTASGTSVSITLASEISVDKLNVSAQISVGSTLHVSGVVTFGSSLNVSGAVSISSTLWVCGATTLNGLTVSGAASIQTLSITGNASVQGTLWVSGGSTFNGITNSGILTTTTLNVTANASVQGTLWVCGTTTLNGLTISGNLTASNLSITANATVVGTLKACGAVTFSSTLQVSSDVTLSAKLNVSAAASLSSTLHVSGAVTFGSTLQISGQATFSGNVIVSGTLTVTGNTSLSGTLNVASVANFNSSISVGNTLYVCGSSTLCGGITVNGVSNFGAAVSIGSTLHVSGNTTMSGTLTVGGVANFNNFINNAEFCAYTSWVIIQHNFWTCGTFTRLGDPTGTAFTGFLNVQASMSCNNTLHVCGDATFNSNFTLTGTATIYGNICSTGTLQLKNLCMFGNTAAVDTDAIVRCAHLFTDVATHFGISILPRLQPETNDVNTQYGVYGGISPINGNFDGATLNGLYYRGGAYYITIGGHTACVQTGADLAGVDLYNGCAQFSYAYGVRTRGINIVGGTNAAKGIATYGVKVESNGVINSGGYTAQFGIAIDTLTGGSYNYQMFLSGAGTGTGIWFSTVANGPRIFASATNDLNVSINNTSIISITTSGFTIVSGTTTKSIILNGDSTATSGIRFNSNLGVHIGGATGSDSNATAYNTYISNMTVGSASNDFVMWDTVSHTLHYCAGASARIYKTDIRDFEDNWRGILDVHPKIFTKIKNGLESIGYIAEDIEELGIEKLLIRFPDGRLKGLKYEKFSLYAIEVIKEQDKRIKRLEDEVTQMASTINQMAHKIMGET